MLFQSFFSKRFVKQKQWKDLYRFWLCLHFMKLLALILLVAFLAACTPPVAENKVVCAIPFSAVNGACCLDKNKNGLCDRDETQRVETIIRERPVILVNEVCNLPRFSCIEKKITPNYVKLKLRFERDEMMEVTKISLKDLQCSQEVNATLLNLNDEFDITIPCVIDRDAIRTDVITEGIIQPVLRYSNGQIFDYGKKTPASLKGEISGIVR